LEGHVYLTGEEGLNRIELVTSESPPNANATTVTDTCIAGNNPVTFSAGVWTKDGVPIGRTFPDGVTLPGGGTASETYTLPDVPNDWHWSATIPRPAGSLTFNFDGFFAAEADIVVPIVDAFVTSPVLTLTADLLVDGRPVLAMSITTAMSISTISHGYWRLMGAARVSRATTMQPTWSRTTASTWTTSRSC
jgi:hypothetical protein